MKCLVVAAHPLQGSLCMALAEHVVESLQGDGHEVNCLDLYGDGFEASMSAQERQSYYTESYDLSAVATHVTQLQDADSLVLVFPTWWFGFPAILKGWFDRVWAPGIAYDHAANYGPIRPRLHNLRRVLAITTLGAPWWVDYFVMRRPVQRILKIALLHTCAPGCRFQMLSLYQCEALESTRVETFKKRIAAALAR